MIKLLSIVGARPQIIKSAALSRAIRNEFSSQVRDVILHTGQHYDSFMSGVFFEEMQIPEPAYNLGIGSSSHGTQTGQMIEGIEKVILDEKPDGVVVYGDTNSTLAGALAAAKLHYPVIHIEAGLRSFNKQMPEEINRITSDHVSTLLFSPTLTGLENLAAEGITAGNSPPYSFDRQGVFHSGDVMYDNTLFFRELAATRSNILKELDLDGDPFILVTVHRPSNTDVVENLREILSAIHGIAREHAIPVVFPMHPRTSEILEKLEQKGALQIPDRSGMVRMIRAVSFLDMVLLENGASVILTDSGGVQKEAWFMKKPVVVLRDETEWVEIIEHGCGELAGASAERIMKATGHFLRNPPSDYPAIFGDGSAAREILKVLTSVQWR